jgi:hypothetical protein
MKCISGETRFEYQGRSRHGVSQLILTLCLVQFGLRTFHTQRQARTVNII